ncbi:transposase [Streptomyces caeni]|uniref:Transposase n=1 Tax=Streptomyces caeni TaxID=2307231 RepID=A0ABW4IJH2_9ACTN
MSGRSRSSARDGHRPKRVMTEVGTVTVQVPGAAGHLPSRAAAEYDRRTGGLEEVVLSLTAQGLRSGETVAHLAEVTGRDRELCLPG